MEILAALREGPLVPSRLAQRCNINYGRLEDELEPLIRNGWVVKDSTGDQNLRKLTQEGLKTYLSYETLWNKYQRGVKLTSGQQGFKSENEAIGSIVSQR
jgi:predicted transcriptional regulator